MDSEPRRTFATKKAWQQWLHRNHAKSKAIWIQMALRSTGIKSATHPEALEVALCYGWIDGLAKRFDENYSLRRFIPRRKDSIWSQINRAKAMTLIEQGLMQPAGFAAIEQAKANGRWDAAYQPVRDKTIPDDLQASLNANPKAAKFFETLNKQNRYAIIFRLQTAKKSETRIARLQKFVGMLERGETLY